MVVLQKWRLYLHGISNLRRSLWLIPFVVWNCIWAIHLRLSLRNETESLYSHISASLTKTFYYASFANTIFFLVGLNRRKQWKRCYGHWLSTLMITSFGKDCEQINVLLTEMISHSLEPFSYLGQMLFRQMC